MPQKTPEPPKQPPSSPPRDLVLLVPAAGSGKRLSPNLPKAFFPVLGRPLLVWTLEALAESPRVSKMLVAVPPGWEPRLEEQLEHQKGGWVLPGSHLPITILEGGSTRGTTVERLVAASMKTPPSQNNPTGGLHSPPLHEPLTAIHDGARPGVTPALIHRVAEAALKHGAALPVWDCEDTIKELAPDGRVEKTLDRRRLARAQTPQIVRTELLKKLLFSTTPPKDPKTPPTDEASRLEAQGHPVAWVKGEPTNWKLTWSEQVPQLEALLHHRRTSLPLPTPPKASALGHGETRVGIGFDAHAFVSSRPLKLGGVSIPYAKGLQAHSDGDVLIHALADALLGSVACGDLGTHFPPNRPETKGLSGAELLGATLEILSTRGFRPRQVDVTVIAQHPRIAPHREAIKSSLAKLLDLPCHRISVKATTTEGLGYTGGHGGMAAQALAVVERAK